MRFAYITIGLARGAVFATSIHAEDSATGKSSVDRTQTPETKGQKHLKAGPARSIPVPAAHPPLVRRVSHRPGCRLRRRALRKQLSLRTKIINRSKAARKRRVVRPSSPSKAISKSPRKNAPGRLIGFENKAIRERSDLPHHSSLPVASPARLRVGIRPVEN
jgi:hypothetical protein